MCKNLKFKTALLGLLLSLGGLISVSAQCPSTATDVGSGQSIGTFAKGSLINVQSGSLPGGVAPCQAIIVTSSVKYAGTTTYAWSGTTATVTPVTGLTIFGTPETPVNVAPANFTTVVLSDPADPTCPGILTENLVSFEYTPSAADIAAGGVTFVLQYAGIAQSGANDTVTGSATITVKIHGCDDGNACTTDTCVPNLAGLAACANTPINCDDGNACTTDSCVAGACQNTPIICDDGNACTTDTCDPASGCVYTPIICDDGNACTTDTCDTASGCVYTPNPPCNDNNACTTDTCDPASGCVYTPNPPCNDNNACTTDTCDPASGCVYTPISCDDSNTCTIDTCDPTLGCQHAPNPACVCVTRTQGYWFNHVTGGAGCATLQAAITAAGGSFNLGFTTVNLDQALGYFWTKGKNANSLCAARQKAATQLIAAIANTALLNQPGTCSTGTDLIAQAQHVLYCGTIDQINSLQSQLDAFNNSGDSQNFPAGLQPCSAGKDQKAYIDAHAVAPGSDCNTTHTCP